MSASRNETLSERRKFLLKVALPENTSDYGEYLPSQRPTTTDEEILPEIDSLPSKRRRVENEEKIETAEEQKSDKDEEYDFWRSYIREKFLRYMPKYVSAMTSIAELKCVQEWYRPCSQPHSRHEFVYFDLVAKAADERLRELL